MYSLSDHYIFTETIIYDAIGNVTGKETSAVDITPIFMLIIILIFFVVLNEFCKSILYAIKKAVELRNIKKKNKQIKYDTFA